MKRTSPPSRIIPTSIRHCVEHSLVDAGAARFLQAQDRTTTSLPVHRRTVHESDWLSVAVALWDWLKSESFNGWKKITSRSIASPEPAWAASSARCMPPACLPPRFRRSQKKSTGMKRFCLRRFIRSFLSGASRIAAIILINAPLGLKHGLSGPNGFNSGQGIGLLLDRIAFPESGVASFDDLPIPFRCVATDMLSGEGVVLRQGALAQAVRASMAIPGVFTPVEINGRVLADGGMVQNIPVETVLGMDADSVIAVELRLPPGNPKELETITGVLTRAVDVMITQNERHSLALARATVSIDMSGFAITDYGRVKELVKLG